MPPPSPAREPEEEPAEPGSLAFAEESASPRGGSRARKHARQEGNAALVWGLVACAILLVGGGAAYLAFSGGVNLEEPQPEVKRPRPAPRTVVKVKQAPKKAGPGRAVARRKDGPAGEGDADETDKGDRMPRRPAGTAKPKPPTLPDLSTSAGPANEEEAIAVLVRLGGKVAREGGRPDGPAVSVNFNVPAGDKPVLLDDPDLIPLGKMPKLRQLALQQTKISDKGLEPLKGLKMLESLTLGQERQISDEGLAHVVGLTGLTQLLIPGTALSDNGLGTLKGLVNLRVLDLASTAVTDAGLKHLASFPRLESLSLSGTGVTDAGLAQLKGLPGLLHLHLAETGVSDAGLAQLAGLTKLRSLSLDQSKVTNAGLAHLANLAELRVLRLAGTGVTDAGMAQLGKLTQLEQVVLRDTTVSNQGVALLKQALPKVKVER
jgi:hypothetical protein